MQPIPFIAESAEDAVAQIRERLGPEAVVLNVRPLPANGLARLWQKPMIEVLAHRPEPAAPETPAVVEGLAELRQQLQEIRQQVKGQEVPAAADNPEQGSDAGNPNLNSGQWRVGALLQRTGLSPLHAQFVSDQLRSRHGEVPPTTLGQEIALARNLLAGLWRYARPAASHSLHVLVGPPGSGKSTYLCKWLTQSVLLDGRSARVWRLDGATANMAESLSVYCEILNVPTERTWETGEDALTEDVGFIDLPGVDWRNPLALKELAGQLRQFGVPHVHLILNGAYDTSILLAQARAFAALPIADISVTHLDEEERWGKVWNLVLGTNYPLRHLCTGQNIPGDFREASAEMLFSAQFPRK